MAKWVTYMFIGEYNHALDDKARVTMPGKFREGLGETFYITKGFDKCLFVFTANEWAKFIEKLEKISMTKTENRTIQRFFISSAFECTLDKQGRVLLSAPQREYAGIEKDITIVGVANRVEIWAKEKWDAYNNSNIDIAELADQLDGFDL